MKMPMVRELVMGASGLALFGTVVASALQGPFDPKSEMIIVGEKAIALLPPVVAGKGDPKAVGWSSDGKWLLIIAEDVKVDSKALAEFIAKGATGAPPITAESVLTMFDAEKNATKEIARYKSDGSSVMQVEWLPGNRNAALIINEPFLKEDGRRGFALSLYVASTSTAKVTRLARFAESQYATIFTDKSVKHAVLTVQDTDALRAAIVSGEKPPQMHWTATHLGPDGKLGAEIRIEGRLAQPFWTGSGAGPYFSQLAYDSATKKRSAESFLLNFASRSVERVTEIPTSESVEIKLGFETEFGQSSNVADTTQVSRRSLWLKADEKSEHQRALIAADADSATLSPIGNGVYYETKGVAMVRPLMSMPKDLALNALEAAERTKAMSDSKQAALALIMYASDYDDTFPSNAGDWASAIDPYLKNRELLDGFTYTYSGGPMSEIEKPAETEIGYKIGPGGRAVAYADGHVKWIPNPKKEQNLSAITRPCSGALLGSMPQGSLLSFSSA